MTTATLHKLFLESTGVSTDSRNVQPGNLYFALKGANFDGNAFAEAALEKGALAAVIDDPAVAGDHFIQVEDGLKALQDLATFHRRSLNLPILALTGSNGKTTTKELIHAVLKERFETVATKGNLNNHIGVPFTLLSMTSETTFGIVEMGANHQGEIAALSAIAEPDYGYITNFGKAHLEGFGGVEGVIKGKSELYTFLRAHEGIAFVNSDDATQIKQSRGIQQITFGSKETADYVIHTEAAQPFAKVQCKDQLIQSHLIGSYNSSNIAAAVAIGLYFEIPLSDIQKAIASYHPENNRSQIITSGSHTVILDAYNANPTSMEAALENLKSQESGYRVALLGDMFEVGSTTAEEHKRIGELAVALGIDEIHLVGSHFNAVSFEADAIKTYSSFEIFQKEFTPIPAVKSATILVKGSRGMAMERILKRLNA